MIQTIFRFATKHREHIITAFKMVYVVTTLILFVGGYFLYIRHKEFSWPLFIFGYTAGRTALVLYCLTLFPGIFRRFGRQFKLVSLLMIYRRYIGITVFLLALTHFEFLRGIDIMRSGRFPTFITFELFGVMAFFAFFLMAVTSNDASTKKLGHIWNRIHHTTYIAAFFVFGHTAMQRVSEWSVLMGVVAVVMVISHIYAFWKRKMKPAPSAPQMSSSVASSQPVPPSQPAATQVSPVQAQVPQQPVGSLASHPQGMPPVAQPATPHPSSQPASEESVKKGQTPDLATPELASPQDTKEIS